MHKIASIGQLLIPYHLERVIVQLLHGQHQSQVACSDHASFEKESLLIKPHM